MKHFLRNHQFVFLTHTSCVGNYILVATGLLYTHGKKTEIVDLNNSGFGCDLPDFPINLAYAAGGVVNGIPIICGGANSTIHKNGSETNFTKHKDCYEFKKREWKLMKNISLDKPKFYFGTGINLVIKDKLLIHGGLTEDIQDKFYNFADSSEWIGLNTHMSNIPALSLGGHCNIMIDKTHFMVTGGLVPLGRNASRVTNKTYYCQMDEKNLKKCIAGPDLKHRRRAHSCYQRTISGKQILHVIGGYVNNQFTNSTDEEYLDMSVDESKRQWEVGKFSFN